MGVSSFFKNLFGSAKDSAATIAEKIDINLSQSKEAATPYMEKAEELAEETISKVETALEEAKLAAAPILEKAENYADQVQETITEFSQEAGEKLGNAIASIKENAEIAKNKIDLLTNEVKEIASSNLNSSLKENSQPENKIEE